MEGGVGAADGGIGRSVNADLAAVIGTYKHPEDTWNYYASMRLAGSHGCFNLLCEGGEGASGTRSPGALIPLGVVGATARVSDSFAFCEPMVAVFVNFASRDLKRQHVAKKGDHMAFCTRLLSPRIGLAPLSLSDDVEFAQIKLCCFPELFAAFQLAAAELSP
ncbi:MAG: hypothetical protein ABR907_04130 [Terracidiphilus sp.]